MPHSISRREFIASASAAAACTTAASGLISVGSTAALAAGQAGGGSFRHTLHKAVFAHLDDDFGKIKAAGFEGIECLDWNVSPEQARQGRKKVEAAGLRIHSVLLGWLDFNSIRPNEVEDSLGKATVALRAAQFPMGADTILLVPCKVGSMAMPNAWEFDIDFNPRTGKLNRVVKGDNRKYQVYIDAQNRATENISREFAKTRFPLPRRPGS